MFRRYTESETFHALKKPRFRNILKMLSSENYLCHVDIVAAFGWDAVAGPLYS